MSQDWGDIAKRLTAVLDLGAPPIAITFTDAAPEGVEAFSSRAAAVSAGCVFWMKSIDRAFTTVAEDHANCGVGSLTHGFIDLATAAGRADVATLVESGWVTPELFPSIPVVATRPAFVTYGPLADATGQPDVVLVRLHGAALMLMSDASPAMAIEGKPQCHIVAVAKEQQRLVASVGCALSRARTGMPDTEMTCAIPGSTVAALVETLGRTRDVDATVARYARADSPRLADGGAR